MEHKLQDALIELTKRCNLRCSHCGSSCEAEAPEPDKELSAADWVKVVKELAGMGVEKVIFSGGEPTLVPGLEAVIANAHVLGLKYGLITNGLAMSEELIACLKKFPPFGVGVSLDGANSVHNAIRNNDQSWSRAIQTIMRLQDEGIRVCAVTTLSGMNLPGFSRLAYLMGRVLEIECWQLQLALPAGRMGEQKHLLLSQRDFKRVCSLIRAFKGNYPEIQVEAADCFGMAEPGVIRTQAWSGCGAGLTTMGIDSTGRIMPCLSLRDHFCGHVRDGIRNVWEKSAGFDFNRQFDPAKVSPGGAGHLNQCAACDLLPACRGGCASQSFFTNGRFHDAPYCYQRSFRREIMIDELVKRSAATPPAGILKYGLPDDAAPATPVMPPVEPGSFFPEDPGPVIKYGLPEDTRPDFPRSKPRRQVVYKYGLPDRRR